MMSAGSISKHLAPRLAASVVRGVFIAVSIAIAIAVSVVLCTMASSGCRKSNSETDLSSEQVAKNLLDSPPSSMSHPSGATFGDSVVYLGADVDANVLSAGGTASVTHYFQVIKPPGADWALFTHVVGEGSEWANADSSPMRRAHPVSAWEAGQIIADRQTISIDKQWAAKVASVRVGLYRKSAKGKGKRMPVSGGNSVDKIDKENRLIAADITVERAASRQKTYAVRRARGPIEIDGRGTETAWQSAPWSGWFVPARSGGKPVGRARSRLLWDDDHLYVLIEVEDTEIFSPFKNRDDTLWKGDVVELFIDADRNRRGYIELQVNPNNAVFDAFFPRTRAHKHHFEWNSSLVSAVTIEGERWVTEIAIPHRDVKGMSTTMNVRIPPAVGDRWRLNVVRVDKVKGAKSITASSWNLITIRDFHALGRMLVVVFADADGKTNAADPSAVQAADPSAVQAADPSPVQAPAP